MIYSMTGFGRTAAEINAQTGWSFEISSVNRKQLEVRINLPREFNSLEPDIRNFLKGRISRGMVNIKGTYTSNTANDSNNFDINEELLEQLVASALNLSRKHPEFNLASFNLSSFYNVPGVIATAEIDTADPELLDGVLKALNSALEQFIIMRRNEGRELENDLRTRLNLLQSLLEKIIPFTKKINENIRTNLLAKCGEAGLNIDLNDERLLKEIVFYADKGDVSEEITRLKSHFIQFENFLTNSKDDNGRSLDFLVQEMFREINTLGNKSGSCDISPLVVTFKTELEKMREQIQNVE